MANNLIQIKRSTTTATPASLAHGEFAFTTNGNVLYIGSNSTNIMAVGGERVPGTLTANQALVANTTGGIDKIITANLVPQKIYAGGSFGGAGFVLATDAGGNVYWSDPGTLVTSPAGSNTQVQYNDSGVLGAEASFVYNKDTDTLTLTNAIASAIINVGSSAIVGNSTQLTLSTAVGLSASGSKGTSGQVLTSNGTTAYWNTPTVYSVNTSANSTSANIIVGGTAVKISGAGTTTVAAANATDITITSADQFTGTVTSVSSGNGLTGGPITSTGTLSVQANNGIVANSSGVFVNANSGLTTNSSGVFVNANNGIVANTSGVFAKAANGVSVDASGINVVGSFGVASNSTTTYAVGANGISITSAGINVQAANGIVANTTGLFAKQSNGITVDTSGILVNANNGIVANTTGVFAKAANGISVDASGINVNGGSTLTVNTSGVHVNTTLSITDLTLTGNLTINGTLTTVDTTNLTVKDPLIKLANNNAADAIDIGLYGAYVATTNTFTGLFRDASDGIYKLFTGLKEEPTATVNTTGTGYTLANLALGALTLTNALSPGNGGTGQSAYAAGDILFSASVNPTQLSKLALGTDGYVLQVNSTSSAPYWGSLDGGTF